MLNIVATMPSTYAILFIAVSRQEIRALHLKLVCCDWWRWWCWLHTVCVPFGSAVFVCAEKKNAINSIQIQLNGLNAHQCFIHCSQLAINDRYSMGKYSSWYRCPAERNQMKLHAPKITSSSKLFKFVVRSIVMCQTIGYNWSNWIPFLSHCESLFYF